MKTISLLSLMFMASTLHGSAQDFHLSSIDDISVRTAGYPRQVLVADFNEDGIYDLLMLTTSQENYLSVYLGSANGKFNRVYRSSLKYEPGFAIVGDFNGDGHADVAALERDHPIFVVLNGIGDGNLETAAYFNTPDKPVFIVGLDINNNKAADLIIGGSTDKQLGIYLDGSFSSYTKQPLAGIPVCAASGDFNSDGRSDIAVGLGDKKGIEILTGDDKKKFTQTSTFRTRNKPNSIAVIDFDLDGKPDVVTGNIYSVSVAYGKGDGNFFPVNYAVSDLDSLEQAVPVNIYAGDFNHDGLPDFAMSGGSGAGIYFCNNKGNRSFENTYSIILGANFTDGISDEIPGYITVSDLNHDGYDDVLVPGHYNSECAILLNDKNKFKSYDYARYFEFPGSNVIAADFNEDGYDDVAVSQYEQTYIYKGTTNGLSRELPSVIHLINGEGFYAYTAMAAVDLNNDGHIDLIGGGDPFISKNNLTVRLGNGDGTFSHIMGWTTGGISPVQILSGDFTNDGNQDLLISATGVDDIKSICYLQGDGDGSFKPPFLIDIGNTSAGIATGDFNHDYNLDFAVLSADNVGSSKGILIFSGDGEGNFIQTNDIDASGSRYELVSGDFDYDGNLDLISNTSNIDFELFFLKGGGDGTFDDEVEWPVQSSFEGSFVACDMNQDGYTDLLGSADSAFSSGAGILFTHADGTFTERHFGCSSGFTVLADINGDHMPDVVSYARNDNQISMLYNTSTASIKSVSENDATDENFDFSVYPDPSTGVFTLRLYIPDEALHSVAVQIRNTIGQLIYSRSEPIIRGNLAEHIQLDNSLPGGIYYIHIKAGNEYFNQKIIIE